MKELINFLFPIDITKEPFPLSKEQKNAVLSKEKVIKILACAGAGKTETLARKVCYLIEKNSVDPEDIIVFTFNRNAASEIKSRIYERMKFYNNSRISQLDNMFIGTIHSFCLEVLKNEYNVFDYDILDERKELLYLILMAERKINFRHYHKSQTLGIKVFYELLNIVSNGLLNEEEIKKYMCSNYPLFLNDFKLYNDDLEKKKLMPLWKLEYITARLLEKKSYVKKIKYLIVDEFQDVSYAQFVIIKNLVKEDCSLCIVGDPNQSIYNWRGTNQKHLTLLETYYPQCKTFDLNVNRRSGKKIIHFANQFKKIHNVKTSDMQPARDTDGIVELCIFKDEEEEAEKILELLINLRKKNIKWNDIAILVRSLNHCEALIEKLKKRSIPFELQGGAAIRLNDIYPSFFKLLAYISNYGILRKRNKKTDYYQLTENDIIEELRVLNTIFNTNVKIDHIKNIKNLISDSKITILDLIREIFILFKFYEISDDSIQNIKIKEFLSMIQSIAVDLQEMHDFYSDYFYETNKLVRTLCKYLNDISIREGINCKATSKLYSETLKIMTIHQSKGLEFPVVIVYGVNKGLFPKKRNIITKINSNILYERIGRNDSITEEYRLFYVAITRAMDHLVITSTKPSEIIEEIKKYIKVSNKLGQFLDEYSHNDSISSDIFQEINISEILTYLKCPYLFSLKHIYNFKTLRNIEDVYINSLIKLAVYAYNKNLDEEQLKNLIIQNIYVKDYRHDMSRLYILNYLKILINNLNPVSIVSIKKRFRIQDTLIKDEINILNNDKIISFIHLDGNFIDTNTLDFFLNNDRLNNKFNLYYNDDLTQHIMVIKSKFDFKIVKQNFDRLKQMNTQDLTTVLKNIKNKYFKSNYDVKCKFCNLNYICHIYQNYINKFNKS